MQSASSSEDRRAEETRRRHGDDFFARIGRKSWELRRRARAGDAAALAALERRRAARGRRRALWQEVLEAQEAVTLLREELAARARANSEPARALLPPAFRYTDLLRRELAQAEERLARLQAAHHQVLRDLRVFPAAE